MARVDTQDLISITAASSRGLSRLVRDVENGHIPILLRNNRPVAAIVSIERLDELDDARDLALAAARALTDTGQRTSLDEILAVFGYTREQLRQHPAYEA